MSPRLRSGQRGAIGLVFAGTLALALVFLLLVVDSGRLYLEKRKLQAVADTAALESANRGGQCSGSTTAVDYAKQNATRNGFTVVANDNSRALAVSCGTLLTNALNTRVFTADATKNDAIRVVASRTVSTGIANGVWRLFSGTYNANTTLTATAVAALAPPVAQLTIRSSLGTITTAKSDILNKVVGGLLGGSLNLTAVGWDGLVTTNVNLLSYLDQLAIQANVAAGDYTTLLNTTVSATQLIDAAVKVLQANGAVATATVNNVLALKAIARNTTVLKLGDLLNVASGTPTAALNTDVQLFQLLQGVAQISNNKSLATAQFQLSIPLIANAMVRMRVIEPPQLSAIGNPALAKAGLATGTNQIFVRTAQVRTLVSLDLPFLNAVSQLTSAVSTITTPVTDVVNNLLHLHLVGLLDPLLCLILKPCEHTDIKLFNGLDINIEAASAKSFVTDFNCANSTTKTLTVQAFSSLVDLKIGQINAINAFASSAEVDVQPIRLIDIGTQTCYGIFGCEARKASTGGGLLLKAESSIGQRTETLFYSPVADMNLTPTYKSISSINIISSLGTTLNGLQVTYEPPPASSASSTTLIGVIASTLVSAIQGLLSPLLDPIVNTLLAALGINLGNAEVGANLTCHMGRAYLVI